MEQQDIYVGIDVAKARVDVAIRPGRDRREISNDEPGIAALVAQMQQLNPAALVLEASGGLELSLVAALASASLPVVVVNPRQVRDFAKATGRLAKTDSLDAAVLAHFAEAVRPPLRPLRDAETQALNSLVACRQQVMIMLLVAERNRLSIAVWPSGPASRPTSPGSSRSWTTWTKACARPSGRVLYGGRRTTCCAVCPASESRSLSPFWHTCPNWALSTDDKSLPRWAWLPSTGTAVTCGANVPSGAAGPGCAHPSTRGRWQASDQRQLVSPVGDDYFCRSQGVIIRYRRCRIGYGSASRNTEAKKNGRKDATDGGGNGGDE